MMARNPSACARIAAERRGYVAEVEVESARYVPGEMLGAKKFFGKGGHCDCVEGAPGEERIIQLFGDSERGKVPWLFSVPVGEMQFQLDIKSAKKIRMCAHFHQSNILGIWLSYDRILCIHALVEGADKTKRIHVFLEIGKRAVGA